MHIRHGCDLRQMSDTDDLMGSCQNTSAVPLLSMRFLPLIPVSISSKINVSMASFPASTVLIASITRDSSPPLATWFKGFQTLSGIGWKSGIPHHHSLCCNGLTGSDCDVKFHRQEIETYQRIFQFLRQYRCVFLRISDSSSQAFFSNACFSSHSAFNFCI